MTKQRKLSLLASLFLMTGIPLSHAATVEVQWDDLSTFRDVRSTTTTQKKFEQQVVKELEEQFIKAGQSLPADQILKLHITDVDLAGHVNYFYYFNFNGVREVRRVDSPRISLNYELSNESGEVLQSGEEKLRDMGFNLSFYGNHYRTQRTAFPYEKKMIEDWVRESF